LIGKEKKDDLYFLHIKIFVPSIASNKEYEER
jgi:hypothetical protein